KSIHEGGKTARGGRQINRLDLLFGEFAGIDAKIGDIAGKIADIDRCPAVVHVSEEHGDLPGRFVCAVQNLISAGGEILVHEDRKAVEIPGDVQRSIGDVPGERVVVPGAVAERQVIV